MPFLIFPMDQLLSCCDNARNFPTGDSLIEPSTNVDTLQALSSQLEERKSVLFVENESKAQLHFCWTDGETIGLWRESAF